MVDLLLIGEERLGVDCYIVGIKSLLSWWFRYCRFYLCLIHVLLVFVLLIIVVFTALVLDLWQAKFLYFVHAYARSVLHSW